MKDTNMNTGEQIRIKELTSSYMSIKLDNGVAIAISFNPHNIHLHFSGINYEERLTIPEAEINGKPVRLSNYVTIQYKSKKED